MRAGNEWCRSRGVVGIAFGWVVVDMAADGDVGGLAVGDEGLVARGAPRSLGLFGEGIGAVGVHDVLRVASSGVSSYLQTSKVVEKVQAQKQKHPRRISDIFGAGGQNRTAYACLFRAALYH